MATNDDERLRKTAIEGLMQAFEVVVGECVDRSIATRGAGPSWQSLEAAFGTAAVYASRAKDWELVTQKGWRRVGSAFGVWLYRRAPETITNGAYGYASVTFRTRRTWSQ